MERRRDNIYSKIKIRVIFLLILMAMTIVGIIVTSMGMASTLKTSSSVVNIFVGSVCIPSLLLRMLRGLMCSFQP